MPMHPATELSDTDCTCLYLAYFIAQLCGRHLVLRPQLAAPTQCTSYDMRTPTEIVGSFTYFDTQTTFQLLRTTYSQKVVPHDPTFVCIQLYRATLFLFDNFGRRPLIVNLS